MKSLSEIVQKYENKICTKFIPSKNFYNNVGINQKRFGMLLRGEKDMTIKEAKKLSEFFKTPITDLL